MIVTAALIWWNERPEDLAACVCGMATIADRLMAVDGAYARYPGAAITSPAEQARAIRRAARGVGLEADIHTPERLWVGQVEKRAYALRQAAEGSDWVAVVDADWIISGDRDAARGELAGYGDTIDVVSVPFYTPSGPQIASGWHRMVEDTLVWMPHIYRALPDMTVEKFHWHFGARKGREKVWLWGGNGDGRRVLPPHQMQADYRIEHRTLHRTPEQVRASRAFLNDRIKVVALTGQEDDLPELPRPEFDFDTEPDFRDQRRARRGMSARQRHLLRRRGR